MQTTTTIDIGGVPTEVPLIHSSTYLVDLGPTPASGRASWLAQYREALAEYGRRELGGLPVPLEVLATGRHGRMVLRIFAPDPDAAVYGVEAILDGDGPKVVVL